MNREFVLRDNEIAINRPDGTVVIMNLEAYKALRDEKPNAEYQKTINNLRELLEKRNAQLKTAKTIQAGYDFQLKDHQQKLQKAEEEKKALKEKIKLLTDANEILRQDAAVERRKRIEAEQKNSQVYVYQQKPKNVVLWGSTKFPKVIPDYVYVTSNGEVFFTGAEIERKYNLPKGSVSAYFSGKQSILYPRDSRGVHAVDPVHGGFERLGVVRRFTPDIFKNKNLNTPDFTYLEASIETAKQYKNGEL